MAKSITKKGDFKLGKAVKIFKLAKSNLPLIIGNDATNHFKKGFKQDGGQTDAGVWKKRKKDPKGKRRGILIGLTKDLSKSIKLTEYSFSKIAVESVGVPYAARHNEGLDGMPKREFLGDSKVLERKTEKTIREEIKKVFS